MNVKPEQPDTVQMPPPSLIRSMAGGFNAVASHIYLILIPAALDLLLWFGPHFRINHLVKSDMINLIGLMRQMSSTDMRLYWQSLEQILLQCLEQYNLASQLSAFPIGIPSLLGVQALLSGKAPLNTPIGSAPIIEFQSGGLFILTWLLFMLIGLFLGTVYFAAVARMCGRLLGNTQSAQLVETDKPDRLPAFRLSVLAWQAIQVFAMVFLLVVLSLILIVPAVWLSFFLSMISTILGQFVLLLATFSAMWFLIPLIFSPHGIFLCGQSMFSAIASSTRIVRFSLPGTGMFLLTALILYQGLGILWQSPPDSSWLTLIGILGHAFIATGLLAASFIYYNSGLEYIQALRYRSLSGRAI